MTQPFIPMEVSRETFLCKISAPSRRMAMPTCLPRIALSMKAAGNSRLKKHFRLVATAIRRPSEAFQNRHNSDLRQNRQIPDALDEFVGSAAEQAKLTMRTVPQPRTHQGRIHFEEVLRRALTKRFNATVALLRQHRGFPRTRQQRSGVSRVALTRGG